MKDAEALRMEWPLLCLLEVDSGIGALLWGLQVSLFCGLTSCEQTVCRMLKGAGKGSQGESLGTSASLSP